MVIVFMLQVALGIIGAFTAADSLVACAANREIQRRTKAPKAPIPDHIKITCLVIYGLILVGASALFLAAQG